MIGYEKGGLEIATYDRNNKTLIKVSEILNEMPHGIGKIILDFKKSQVFLISDESEIF